MGTSDELRKRIERLNRQRLARREGRDADVESIRRRIDKMRADAPRQQRAPGIFYQRDLPVTRARAARRRWAPSETVSLEDAVPGSIVAGPEGGKAYLVEERLNGPDGAWQALDEALRGALASPDSGLRARLAWRLGLASVAPTELVFLDLETTGLGSSPLFLIGSIAWESDALMLRQYLARDYAEERAAIALSLQNACERRLLVTFNGKSFDLPYLRMRAAAARIPCTLDPPHFDLLHVCRRIWGRALPDCRLQTLESRICRRTRTGDIPGEQIPEAYHAFVRTGNAAEMAEIIRHNKLDLITLMDLMVRLPRR